MLEQAQEDLEALREVRYEPEYYQDYQKMEELDQQIDDKHNEIVSLYARMGRKRSNYWNLCHKEQALIV